MVKSNQRVADYQDRQIREFTAFIVSLVANKKTPRAARSVIAAITIDVLANSSSFAWNEDPEALALMLPHILSDMNEIYARGVMSAAMSVLGELVPSEIKDEALQGDIRQ